ncbi:50S ribosomal protein L3 N(5)-glutamine methyltransferase [Accumulibacter sp.]|uniref:50S ribosomal protein L3 N(5)-glutamine methyltransferase n=1 Tax=Accumulibacter sp. TaxID=2053492 RepID=UPI0025EBBAB0|nr:50S ribosomal protein L3 N(5)-glutamine methyltransferase [Accumulibacter sp.]MCM8594481.1 50S ribosomal protein L3 N(5)-glutamine methyltransferase [Accumulibacter sp.]MDS4048627.1 50S ribosomal protein L3 N(5)-glutamine methyltransferase [Accumulibacter sp.]
MSDAARDELLTLRDLLRFAVSRFGEAQLFFGHGSDNAWDEAAYLLLHGLHLPLDRLEPFLDARLTSSERARLLAIIERRVGERLPAAYLTQEAWLGDYRFHVDQRVIVPRSFIAELLREQFAPWIDDPEAVGAVLDLCTGSGCLAIIAAHAFPQAIVDAVDVSPDALAVARRNVAEYELAGRVHLCEGDLFEPLGRRRYDLIVANPPYVAADSLAALPAEYRHEPRLALAGGEDGLEVTRAILAGARRHLTTKGLLVVEIGHNREALEAAFPDLAFTWLETSAGDQYVFLLHRDDLP